MTCNKSLWKLRKEVLKKIINEKYRHEILACKRSVDSTTTGKRLIGQVFSKKFNFVHHDINTPYTHVYNIKSEGKEKMCG